MIIHDPTMLTNHDWSFPVPIAYGPGRLAEIGQRCAAMGIGNPLIVTHRGKSLLPIISRLQASLGKAGLESAVYSDISPNPRDDEIAPGRAVFLGGNHDAVIAIGGGSAMDGAKAICLTAYNDMDLWDFEYEQTSPDMSGIKTFPRLITIPTTAGSGAETESTAMITHVAKGMKFCAWHPLLKPSLALMDPELTTSMPRDLTAWTGVDALVHCIEAYLVPGFNPLSDALALEGLALIAKWFPIAIREPNNVAARGGMLMGSCLGGISFAKGLGLVHAISHMVGAEYNTHHGLTNGIILPVVLRYNLPGQEDKVRRMAQAMNLKDTSIAGFLTGIEAMLDELGIPKSLKEIGVHADSAKRIAEKAMQDCCARTNPRIATLGDVIPLTEAAISRARQ